MPHMLDEPQTPFPPSSSGKGEPFTLTEREEHGSDTVMTAALTLTAASISLGSCSQLTVTQGCRQFMKDESKEEEMQYFLQQRCPPHMSWIRIGDNRQPAMMSFGDVEAIFPRVSRLPLHASLASSDTWEDQNTSRTLSRHGGGDRSGSGIGWNTPAPHNSFRNTANNAYADTDDALGPPARFGHTAVLYKDSHILIFGGKANEEHYFNDLFQYDASGRLWCCLQEECTDDVARMGLASEQGSPSSSYTSGAPASPLLFASPASSPLVMTRWSEAATAVSPAATAEGNAALPGHNSHSSIRGSHETEVIQGTSVASPSFTAPDNGSTFEDPTLPIVAGSRRNSAARDYNPLLDAGMTRPRRPAGRVGHAAALHQDTMYILSGERLGRYFDDLWTLHIPTLLWQKECSLPFSPRKGHTMHLLPADCTATRARQDMLVVFGGLVKVSRSRPRPADPELPPRSQGEPDFACAPTNAVFLYYPLQRRWCRLKTCGEEPAGRFYHVSQLVTGTALMLVFGGRCATAAQTGDSTTTVTGDGFLNDLHILDVSTGVWRLIRGVSGDIPSPRMCAASVFANGTFGLFAGGGDSYCEDVFEFSLHSRRWRRLKLGNQPACSRPTVTYAMGRLVFFGGFAPRTGVMNRTMELRLSPLSLKAQCLQWWNRCAFEKHLRFSMKSRSSEKEKNGASGTAVERAGSGWLTGSNGQVTPQCSPVATAHSCPPETPQLLCGNRGLCRPTPLRKPSFDHSSSPSVATSMWGGASLAAPSGARDAPPPSPTPPYSRSLSAVFSPLTGASQSMSSWQDAGTLHANLPASVLAHAPVGGTATAFCSPLSVTPPANTIFPSCPGTAISSPRSQSRSESPATVSNLYSVSQVCPCPHTAPTAPQTAPTAENPTHGGASVNNSAAAYTRTNVPLAVADANVSMWVSDWRRGCSPPSPATPAHYSAASSFVRSVSSSSYTKAPGRPSHPPSTAIAGEKPSSKCFITDCARNLGGYVAASFPRITECCWKHTPLSVHVGAKSPTPAAVGSVQKGGGASTGSANGCFHYCTRSQVKPPHRRGTRVDGALPGPSLPPPATYESSAGVVGYRQSPPFAHPKTRLPKSCAGSSSVSPQQQRHASVYFTESASSRASSVHSTRSASTISFAHFSNAYAKQTIQRLEGPNGPFMLRPSR